MAEETPAPEDTGNPQAWGELAERLQNLSAAQEQGGVEGSLPGASQPIPPQGLPQLDRIAQLAERLEAALQEQGPAPYNPAPTPQRPARAEDLLPSPTSLPGMPSPGASWHGGAPWGMDQEAFPLPAPAPYEHHLANVGEPAPVSEFPGAAAANVPREATPARAEWQWPASLGQPFGAPPQWELPGPAPYVDMVDGMRLGPAPYADVGRVPGASAPQGGTGAWQGGGRAPSGGAQGSMGNPTDGAPGHDFGGFPQPEPVDYPRLPNGGSEAAPAAERGAAQPQSEGQGGLLGELVAAIAELRATIAGQQGPKERRPGPQGDGSFVPRGPGVMFGDWPRGDA